MGNVHSFEYMLQVVGVSQPISALAWMFLMNKVNLGRNTF